MAEPTGWLDVTSDAAAELVHEAMMTQRVVTPTRLPSIDRNIFLWGDRRGIPQGSYVIVAAASNFGKTLFGLHLLKSAASVGQRAGMISLDMRNRDAIARLQQSIARSFALSDWLPSSWRPENEYALKNALREWRLSRDAGDVAIHVHRGRDIADVEWKVREGADAGTTFFVVDHLQKIRVPEHRGDVFTTADVVSETIDDLVDELNVTIVGLCQLNRMASRQRDVRPTMFDLHGGTSMESNSTFVLMLDHSRYAVVPESPHLIRSWVLFEKNQMGPKGLEVPVLWDTARLSVDEATPEEEEAWPGQQNGKRKRR
jgi:replicative DNA helicase